ncbi:hypothetical protein KEM52_004367, partial [Ascosphaera acerosa]
MGFFPGLFPAKKYEGEEKASVKAFSTSADSCSLNSGARQSCEKTGLPAKRESESPQSTDDIEVGKIESEKEEDLPDDLKDIPRAVRDTVNFEDDPNERCLTFRYFILVFIFIPLGAFVSQMTLYRTTQATFSVFFVQVASYYLGVALANSLPSWEIRVPFTKWSFNTNPGPWGMKEHVL